MTIEEIQNRMLKGGLTPHEVNEFRVILAGKYSFAAGMLERIWAEKPKIWLELRQEAKSDTTAERRWEATEMGSEERRWKLHMKTIEKMLSALRGLHEVLMSEVRNVI